MGQPMVNGHDDNCTAADDSVRQPHNSSDVVAISGRLEQCELAKAALMALVPITEQVQVPLQFHRLLIGPKGANIRQFNERFEVQIKVPSEETGSDLLTMTGVPGKLALARAELASQMAQWEEDEADRNARNYQAQAVIPQCYHRQIIGPRGSGIQKLKARYGDALQRIDVPSVDKCSDVITISGYQQQVDACVAELEEMARQLDNHVTAELFIHNAVHPRLIGKGGRNLARLCEQLQVEIDMPNREVRGEQANLIRVRGQPDKVDDACDFVVNMATEWLDELREKGDLNECTSNGSEDVKVGSLDGSIDSGKRKKIGAGGGSRGAQGPGFNVVGAPWDTSSQDDFPSICGNDDISLVPAIAASSCTWASRQK